MCHKDHVIISRRLYHFGLAIFAMLVMAMQSASIAHAAQYGDSSHEHNGMVCAVDAIAADQDVILPTPTVIPVPVTTIAPAYNLSFVSASYLTPPGRAPPPRSPPALS